MKPMCLSLAFHPTRCMFWFMELFFFVFYYSSLSGVNLLPKHLISAYVAGKLQVYFRSMPQKTEVVLLRRGKMDMENYRTPALSVGIVDLWS